jgi:hypothetical protein
MAFPDKDARLPSEDCDLDARAATVAADVPSALAALNAGMEIFQGVCVLAGDPVAMLKPNVRQAAIETLENTERFLQGHQRFKTDMEKAANILFSNIEGGVAPKRAM